MGRDADKKQVQEAGRQNRPRVTGALQYYRMDIKRLCRRHLRYGRKVGMGLPGCLASVLIGTAFFTLVRGAQLFAAFRPVNTAFELVPDRYIT